MEEIQYIILIIALSTTWVDYIRPILNRLDFKPFNCSFCLSVWLSLLFSVVCGSLFLLSAPLFLRIIERKLL